MHNRINQLFENKGNNILSVFFTAGYPAIDDTLPILRLLEKHGADMVEIGMPFSDPIADGATIQQSSDRALKNGMSLSVLFKQLKEVRKEVTIPLLLMGYFNPVLQFGVDRFCRQCAETGIDGLILPDLPLDEFEEHYAGIFRQYNLHNILLVTPQTNVERIKEIDRQTGGFIYMVSSSSTTGQGRNAQSFDTGYFSRVNNLDLKHPRLIGFGISDKESFNKACAYAQGAIIGSAFVKALGSGQALENVVAGFMGTIR